MLDISELIRLKSEECFGMPLVMGILNVTPDSFSDGGCFVNQSRIELKVRELVADGADIIDIGGESTRPGADKVSLQLELERVMPVIEWIVDRFDIPVSIDTYKTEVMSEAVASGAQMVNDVNALQAEGAVDFVVSAGVPVCLMHKQGQFSSMQKAPYYNNVVQEVCDFLIKRASVCELAGIKSTQIVLDPGFGFGKTLEHNLELFKNLSVLTASNYAVLTGVSRKRMISELLGHVAVEDRVVGSAVASVISAIKGSSIVRVHDVKETVHALTIAQCLS